MEDILNKFQVDEGTMSRDGLDTTLEIEKDDAERLEERMIARKEAMKAKIEVNIVEAKKEFSALINTVEDLAISYDEASVKMDIIGRDGGPVKFLAEVRETLAINKEIINTVKRDMRFLYTKITLINSDNT